MKIAAGLHGQFMQAYVQKILDEHVREHEKKGVTLNLRKQRLVSPLSFTPSAYQALLLTQSLAIPFNTCSEHKTLI